MSDHYSEEINEIAEALCNFQGQLKTIEKDKQVNIRLRTGGQIKYSYADLSTIMSQIREPLSKNGLSVSHSIQTGDHQIRMLVTTVFHKSGQWLRSSMAIEPTGDEKSLGAKITYYRRYALASLLGIVTDDDVDADLQGGEQVANKSSNPVAPIQQKESFSKEALKLLKDNKKNPMFEEFVNFTLSKCKQPRETVLNEAAKRPEKFYEALEAFEKQKSPLEN